MCRTFSEKISIVSEDKVIEEIIILPKKKAIFGLQENMFNSLDTLSAFESLRKMDDKEIDDSVKQTT